MSYRNDGSPHRNGIKNERDIKKLLDRIYHFFHNDKLMIAGSLDLRDIRFVKRGGTRRKSDIDVLNKGQKYRTISVKRKTLKEDDTPSGTVDIINKGYKKFQKEKHILSDENDNKLNTGLLIYKDKILNPSTQDEYLEKANKLKLEIASNALDSITNVNAFMELTIEELLNTDYLLISNIKDNKIVKIHHSKSNIFKKLYDPNIKYFFIKNESEDQESRRIGYNNENGVTSLTPFRVRLVLNNGIHSYYGLKKRPSSKNKSSSWSFKIQVDGIKEFEDMMKKFDTEEYY